MDGEMASANQGIDDMSFKDLTGRAAAAMRPTPAKTAKTSATDKESKASDDGAPEKTKTS